MPLEFSFEPGFYVVTQITFERGSEKKLVVRYSTDFTLKRVNEESPRRMTQPDKDWFDKHYAPRFRNLLVRRQT